jgi:hypothetical protein
MKVINQSGNLLVATGILHNMVGFIMGSDPLIKILQAGVWNSITGHQDKRDMLVWFLYSGFAMIVMGVILQRMIQRKEQHSFSLIGWFTFLSGVAISVLEPISGGWLLIPQGLILMSVKKKESLSTT